MTKAETIKNKANLIRADLREADLSEANLFRANLSGADLSEADLSEANLIRADLHKADLRGANLRGANLRDANLSGADLREADLSEANLFRANLSGADLSEADLSEANLFRANLFRANLSGADLSGAKNLSDLIAAQLLIVPKNVELIVYKKTIQGIVVLRIPKDAERSNATSRKCRAEYAVVIETPNHKPAFSQHDANFKYIEGAEVRSDTWDTNRWNECSSGIHFFITREEAEAY